MAEDNWGAAEPIRQSVHDLVSAIGKHIGLIPDAAPQSDHDKAVQQMNADANAHKNDAANQSFLDAAQAAAIRKKAAK
jgi:hypothetical protein